MKSEQLKQLEDNLWQAADKLRADCNLKRLYNTHIWIETKCINY